MPFLVSGYIVGVSWFYRFLSAGLFYRGSRRRIFFCLEGVSGQTVFSRVSDSWVTSISRLARWGGNDSETTILYFEFLLYVTTIYNSSFHCFFDLHVRLRLAMYVFRRQRHVAHDLNVQMITRRSFCTIGSNGPYTAFYVMLNRKMFVFHRAVFRRCRAFNNVNNMLAIQVTTRRFKGIAGHDSYVLEVTVTAIGTGRPLRHAIVRHRVNRTARMRSVVSVQVNQIGTGGAVSNDLYWQRVNIFVMNMSRVRLRLLQVQAGQVTVVWHFRLHCYLSPIAILRLLLYDHMGFV